MSDAGAGIPQAGDVLVGKYEVERVLGVGGMGVVVAARHLHLGQRVAIKFIRGAAVIDPNVVNRFLVEARAAAALSSEHVARVIDVGTLETGAPYIVMEHLTGVDLDQFLRDNGPMAVPMAVGFVLQACEAIGEAHVKGIVHRDLKPSNLFLSQRMDSTPLVKVLDFGISKASQQEGIPQNLTASGTIVGSPIYMSPEQIRDAKRVDARSDVWSLGVILYELLTGVTPFAGETLGQTFARVLSEEPTPIERVRPDVPPALAGAIRRCLERDLSLRIQNVGELAMWLTPFAPPGAEVSISRIRHMFSAISAVTPADKRPAGASRPAISAESAGAPVQTASSGIAIPRRQSSPAEGSSASAWAPPSSRVPIALGIAIFVVSLGGAGIYWRQRATALQAGAGAAGSSSSPVAPPKPVAAASPPDTAQPAVDSLPSAALAPAATASSLGLDLDGGARGFGHAAVPAVHGGPPKHVRPQTPTPTATASARETDLF